MRAVSSFSPADRTVVLNIPLRIPATSNFWIFMWCVETLSVRRRGRAFSGPTHFQTQLLLFVFFLLLALLVLLQELAVRIDFDAPLCPFFVHHGFVNGFALFRLLLDLDDLAAA